VAGWHGQETGQSAAVRKSRGGLARSGDRPERGGVAGWLGQETGQSAAVWRAKSSRWGRLLDKASGLW